MGMSGGLRTFGFDSGGPEAMSPYGRWEVTLDSARYIAITHHQGGDHTSYGRTLLSPEQSRALWKLIDAADIENLESSTRAPVPDEGAYTFTLRDEYDVRQAVMWRSDALQDPKVAALIQGLTAGIEQVTGFTPVVLR